MLNTSQIKEKALELGCHLVGIAPAARYPEAEYYVQWVEKGLAGTMEYMNRNAAKREDCRLLFPSARSVIVCGLSYHTSGISPSETDSTTGYISRYARGDDYHVVLKNKLFALDEFIRQESTTQPDTKICVDTVPILERLYGYYAGLGWIGKHGGLINQDYGSWFFLGEILINLDLEYDAPTVDRCGDCRRCLDACPTGALIAPRILDARRCLSYLTIEHRGIIPEELRPLLGNCVFGCDRCQFACPWNHHMKGTNEAAFAPREQLRAPELEWLGTLRSHEFSRVFKNSPVKRTKLSGVVRNVVIAMGNSRNSAYIPLLQQLDGTTDDVVQTHVTWALERLTNARP
ncbi:tRNA epoxyqueuosine(34) reductase QueG [candidate division KSB3 bacterium]|uniref:tRNA epoxyqueuosine(34) reductase QueG n=1 Tax=candidate division KSB3 bacterium TaxID=2044937 RepID=A0A2G6KHR7_9BACT|nr:MAG: tRNA epoxyqueuosine(34) reductase QueG [candidate division KSB3 bacterium]